MPPAAVPVPVARRQPVVTRGDSTRRRRASARARPPPGPWTEGYAETLDPFNFNLANDPANTQPQTYLPPVYNSPAPLGPYGPDKRPLGYNDSEAGDALAGGVVGSYGTVGAMYNGDRAELEFVLKLSGFFVLAAYAVLAVIFFVIMHFSRNLSQYTRPRYDEDERDRQYADIDGTRQTSAVQRMTALNISHTSSLPRQRSRNHLNAHTRSASQGNEPLDSMVAIDIPEHVALLINSPHDDEPPDPF